MRLPISLSTIADELAVDGLASMEVLADLATCADPETLISEIACAHDGSAGHRAVAPFLRRIVEVLAMVETDLPPLPARMVSL